MWAMVPARDNRTTSRSLELLQASKDSTAGRVVQLCRQGTTGGRADNLTLGAMRIELQMISAYKFPPFFERGTCLAEPHRPRLSFFFFAKKFFRAPHTRARMRWNGQIFWLLASGA